MKKTITLFVILILAIVVFGGCSNADSDFDANSNNTINNNYEECVKTAVDLRTGVEISWERTKKMQPEAFIDNLEEEGDGFSGYYKSVQQQCKTNANVMTTVFGKDYETSYKIIRDDKLNNEEQYQATKHLNSAPWYNAEDVNEVRELIVEITITGDKNSKTFETTVRVIQIGEGWYTLNEDFSAIDDFLN